jgi:AraC-like DNA-binding protein
MRVDGRRWISSVLVDLVADVLAVTGVRGTVAASVRAGEKWGLRLDRVPGAAFHSVTAGTAWLRVKGHEDVRLMTGDVVLLPSGTAHGLSGERRGPLAPFDHLAAEQAVDARGVLQVGTGREQTRILCASYRHEAGARTPFLTLLPEVVHVPAGQGSPALDDTVRLIASELAHPQMATSTVLDRLVDVVLIQLLRSWLRIEGPGRPPSWLGALSDPTIASALHALHRDPGSPWTVEKLASKVAVSRATLARRFLELVGETPSAYLTRWRMDLAAQRLRDTDEPITAIARAVGYTSEYAFSRAFARQHDQPPGRYRTSSRASRSSRRRPA